MELAVRSTVTTVPRSEEALVRAARRGDDRAFEQLYAQYRERVTAFVHSKVGDHGRAEDISQEVFMAALRQLRASDQPIAFKPWIFAIAKNACIDEFRRSARGREVPVETDEDFPAGPRAALSVVPSPPAAIEGKQRLDDLRGAFGGLSESHHRLIVMRELEGRSYDEIGSRLGMTRQMVESGLFRARRKLSEEYDELASGRRCEQVQTVVDSGAAFKLKALGIKERRRVTQHLSHCQGCRQHARLAGIDEALLKPRSVAGRIAAFLPFGGGWRRLWHRGGSRPAGAHASGHLAASGAVQAAGTAGSSFAIGPAAAALTALAIAGAGGGVAIAQHDNHGSRPASAHRVSTRAAGAAGTGTSGGSGTGTTSAASSATAGGSSGQGLRAQPTAAGSSTGATTLGTGTKRSGTNSPAPGQTTSTGGGPGSATPNPGASTSTAGPSTAGPGNSASSPLSTTVNKAGKPVTSTVNKVLSSPPAKSVTNPVKSVTNPVKSVTDPVTGTVNKVLTSPPVKSVTNPVTSTVNKVLTSPPVKSVTNPVTSTVNKVLTSPPVKSVTNPVTSTVNKVLTSPPVKSVTNPVTSTVNKVLTSPPVKSVTNPVTSTVNKVLTSPPVKSVTDPVTSTVNKVLTPPAAQSVTKPVTSATSPITSVPPVKKLGSTLGSTVQKVLGPTSTAPSSGAGDASTGSGSSSSDNPVTVVTKVIGGL